MKKKDQSAGTKIYVILKDGELGYWHLSQKEADITPGKVVGALATVEYCSHEKRYQEYFKLQLKKGKL